MTKQEFIQELQKQKNNLSGIDLSHSILNNTCLRGANFTQADLRYTDLTKADLTEARVCHSQIEQMHIIEDKLTDPNK